MIQGNKTSKLNIDAIQGFGAGSTPQQRQLSLQYFEQVCHSNEGWKTCGIKFSQKELNDEVSKFFCLRILEHHVTERHLSSSDDDVLAMRSLLLSWLKVPFINHLGEEPPYVRNKMAQIIALVFVQDYPRKWPSFFYDLLGCITENQTVLDLFLRILLAIDTEIVDREIIHTKEENIRNTLIKDTMRDECVPQLVSIWAQILQLNDHLDTGLLCLAMNVVGLYVSWIDIGLIANDRFISLLLKFMSVMELKEAACDCLHDIISKGMDPVAKVELVESLVNILESSGVLAVLNMNDEDEDLEFLEKLSKLMNGIGNTLVLSYTKLCKLGNDIPAKAALDAIDSKLPALIKLFGCEDDDVSAEVIPFLIAYVNLFKGKQNISDDNRKIFQTLLLVLIEKMKFDETYNFMTEGEDEANFLEFRKQLKNLFGNIALIDPELVLHTIEKLVLSTLADLESAHFAQVEVGMRLFYILGEVIVDKGNHFGGPNAVDSPWYKIMVAIVTSQLFAHKHIALCQVYFELVVRYDRIFAVEQELIPIVLNAFFSQFGLKHSQSHVRSRCCYHFSRFIKSVRSYIGDITEHLLFQMKDLLSFECLDSGYYSNTDQNFLYESVGYIIVNSRKSAEEKCHMMKTLLGCLVERFKLLLPQLHVQEQAVEVHVACSQKISDVLSHASRISKVFPNHQTTLQSGCLPCFVEVLPIFLQGLEVLVQREVVHAGVRQFLHRMIICLGDELLRYIPVAVQLLLKDSSSHDIQEFIPLINQLITKYKHRISPFLTEVFMPVVESIMKHLNTPFDPNDKEALQDHTSLQRCYYLFLISMATNGVYDVFESQRTSLVEQILVSLIQGATNSQDHTIQKNCFGVLKRLVEVWGSGKKFAWFVDVIYKHLIPACFEAPLRQGFDMNDGHAFLALGEICGLFLSVANQRGQEYFDFLEIQYLPSLHLSPAVIQHLLQILHLTDHKVMKKEIRDIFCEIRKLINS